MDGSCVSVPSSCPGGMSVGGGILDTVVVSFPEPRALPVDTPQIGKIGPGRTAVAFSRCRAAIDGWRGACLADC